LIRLKQATPASVIQPALKRSHIRARPAFEAIQRRARRWIDQSPAILQRLDIATAGDGAQIGGSQTPPVRFAQEGDITQGVETELRSDNSIESDGIA